MTLDQIFQTAVLSLAECSDDLVLMVSEHDIKEAASVAGYIERGGWGLLVEDYAELHGLKLEFTGGYVTIRLLSSSKQQAGSQ